LLFKGLGKTISHNVSQARNGTLNALAFHGMKERAVE
jgi:hypothetical protein